MVHAFDRIFLIHRDTPVGGRSVLLSDDSRVGLLSLSDILLCSKLRYLAIYASVVTVYKYHGTILDLGSSRRCDTYLPM